MGFREDLQNDTIASLTIRKAIEIEPHTLIRAAVAMMQTHSLGCAVMVDAGRRPTGIFTEHSLIEVLMRDASLDDSPVLPYADPDFVELKISDPILSVWNAVQSDAARFVCVSDDQGKLVGITGQRGLSEYLADCFAKQVTVQRLGSTPWLQQREGA